MEIEFESKERIRKGVSPWTQEAGILSCVQERVSRAY